MALFKVYHAVDENDLPINKTTGNSYIIDDENNDLVRWFIDTSSSTRKGIASEGLVDNGEIILADDLKTVAYVRTVSSNDWIQSTGDTQYHQDITLPLLVCGKDGNVPPIITYASEVDRIEYQNLDKAEADPDNNKIILWANAPTSGFNIVIIDHK